MPAVCPHIRRERRVGAHLRPRGGADAGRRARMLLANRRYRRRADRSVYLDYLTWDGEPDVVLARPEHGGTLWRRAWVDGVDQFDGGWPEPFRIVQNQGTGLLIHGARDWRDYHVRAAITPHLALAAGIAARVQGMRRYYALLLCAGGVARLIKAL